MIFDFNSDFDAIKARKRLEYLIQKKAVINLSEKKKKRTIRQNAYMHVCLGLFCMETGYTMKEAKELFSYQLPDLMRYTKNEFTFQRSTSELDTSEMSILIDNIRETALDQLGLYIPTSEEYLANQVEIEKSIQNVRE